MRQAILSQITAKQCQKVVDALIKNRFQATYCETLQDARQIVLAAAQSAQSIGFGGSLSVAQMSLESDLAGKELLRHGVPNLSAEQRMEIMRKQLTCDLFLTGTNALTSDGTLVNVDGNGNRVAAMIFGPRTVIVIAGRNKLVEGDAQAARRKIAQLTAPANAFRLSRKTPCAEQGICSNCHSPDRICRVTTVLEQCPCNTAIHVLVVNEDLGL